MKRRVAITGIGLVTPVGNDVTSSWSALVAGKSGVAPISLFDARGFSTRIAAEVKGFDERAIDADRRLLKFANRSHKFALAAAEQAMRDAGIAPTPETGARWGCSVGLLRCQAVVTDRGWSISCSEPGRSVAFVIRR